MSELNRYLIKPITISTVSALFTKFTSYDVNAITSGDKTYMLSTISFISSFIATELLAILKQYGYDQWFSYPDSKLMSQVTEAVTLFAVNIGILFYLNDMSVDGIDYTQIAINAGLSELIGNWLADVPFKVALDKVETYV